MTSHVLIPSQKGNPRKTLSHKSTPKSSGGHDSLTVPPHPLKIRPSGNVYTASVNIKLAAGLLAALPDELLIQVLEFFDAASLKRLGWTCKALYAFSRFEDLWKTLCIEYGPPLFPDLSVMFDFWTTPSILNITVGIIIIQRRGLASPFFF